MKLRLQISSIQPTKLHSLRPQRKSQPHQQFLFVQFYSDDDCVFLGSLAFQCSQLASSDTRLPVPPCQYHVPRFLSCTPSLPPCTLTSPHPLPGPQRVPGDREDVHLPGGLRHLRLQDHDRLYKDQQYFCVRHCGRRQAASGESSLESGADNNPTDNVETLKHSMVEISPFQQSLTLKPVRRQLLTKMCSDLSSCLVFSLRFSSLE